MSLLSVPTVEQVLAKAHVGNGFYEWDIEGGRVRVPLLELQKACESAYDSSMPYWPSLVEEELQATYELPEYS